MNWPEIFDQLRARNLRQKDIVLMSGLPQSTVASLAIGETKNPTFATGMAILRVARDAGVEIPDPIEWSGMSKN